MVRTPKPSPSPRRAGETGAGATRPHGQIKAVCVVGRWSRWQRHGRRGDADAVASGDGMGSGDRGEATRPRRARRSRDTTQSRRFLHGERGQKAQNKYGGTRRDLNKNGIVSDLVRTVAPLGRYLLFRSVSCRLSATPGGDRSSTPASKTMSSN